MNCEDIQLDDLGAVDRIEAMEDGAVLPPKLPRRGSGHKRAMQRNMERHLPSFHSPQDGEFINRQPMPRYFCNIKEHPWNPPVNCEIAKIVCLIFICILLALVITFVAHCVEGIDEQRPHMVNVKKGCFSLITCVCDEVLALPSPPE